MRGAVPDFTAEEAVGLVRSLYRGALGLGDRSELAAAPLSSYIDQNYRIAITTGEGNVSEYVLKIANSAENEAQIDMETEAMLCLARAPGVNGRCPVPLRGDAGTYYTRVTHPRVASRTHLVRLTSLLKGGVMAKAPQTQELLFDLGGLLGAVACAFSSMKHRAAHRFLRWDVKAAGHVSPLVDMVFGGAEKAAQRDLVQYFLRSFEEEVSPVMADLPQQIIHGDANDYNILCADGAVTGLCDFGDMVHTPAVCELAVCLAYVMMDKQEPLRAAAAVLRGYAQRAPLCAPELRALWWLVAGRLCVSVVVSAYEVRLQPENAEYVAISERPAWDLLRKMREISHELALAVFFAAAGKTGEAPAWLRRQGVEIAGEPPSATEPPPCAIPALSPAELVAFRGVHCPRTLSTQYSEPLKIVRGRGAELFDADGRGYLDCVNNVCHVGHCHPRVVRAAQQQIERLNTNTRYLHDNLAEYLRRLLGTLPAELDTAFLVCSGSEANELAFRLACTATGRRHMVVVDHAYHGHTNALVGISPYKFRDQARSTQLPEHVTVVPMPDPYRGPCQGPEAGRRYAEAAAAEMRRLGERGIKPAAFWAESLMGVGGQIIPPDGWLAACHEAARAHGALCIADEVQVGFGRVGSGWWAFAAQGGTVVPDIVTMGKPIGNGHPMAAVVCKRWIADKFADTGMEYFSTFGGNPVSCAVGIEVLRVVAEEGLMRNAEETGALFLRELRQLQQRHAIIGDVRGKGLFVGVELVRDRETKEPAADAAGAVSEGMKRRGVLVTRDGPLENVLKIKPPIVFDASCVHRFCAALDSCLSELEQLEKGKRRRVG
eukprot:TRINITY_DN3854_c0_g1_i1.p1 TRINITY_DN3854_c0_g1~~TRINITY_DN3854_c0_g1_i1.p1  ORF type:complete len:855 (+),score=294.74 TRINITY_DN3854_c0_g1_i1:75-2567(+)